MVNFSNNSIYFTIWMGIFIGNLAYFVIDGETFDSNMLYFIMIIIKNIRNLGKIEV